MTVKLTDCHSNFNGGSGFTLSKDVGYELVRCNATGNAQGGFVWLPDQRVGQNVDQIISEIAEAIRNDNYLNMKSELVEALRDMSNSEKKTDFWAAHDRLAALLANYTTIIQPFLTVLATILPR